MMAVCIGSTETTNLPEFCLEILIVLLHLTNFLLIFHILLVSFLSHLAVINVYIHNCILRVQKGI